MLCARNRIEPTHPPPDDGKPTHHDGNQSSLRKANRLWWNREHHDGRKQHPQSQPQRRRFQPPPPRIRGEDAPQREGPDDQTEKENKGRDKVRYPRRGVTGRSILEQRVDLEYPRDHEADTGNRHEHQRHLHSLSRLQGSVKPKRQCQGAGADHEKGHRHQPTQLSVGILADEVFAGVKPPLNEVENHKRRCEVGDTGNPHQTEQPNREGLTADWLVGCCHTILT